MKPKMPKGHFVPDGVTQGRPFPKGVSGNPGGVPKWVKKIRDLCQQHTAEAVDALVELMRQKKDLRVRLGAAEAILDRAGVKAIQVALTDGEGVPVVPAITVQFVRPPTDGGPVPG